MEREGPYRSPGTGERSEGGRAPDAALLDALAALERRNQELEELLAEARRELARLKGLLEAR